MSYWEFLIEDMTFSYSRLTAYEQCHLKFKFGYIDALDDKKIEGFFGQFGKHGHNILQKYEKNEADIYELSGLYTDLYREAVTTLAPPNKYVDLNESYYVEGKEYFNSFSGFDFKIIEAEELALFDVEGVPMKGYPDLIGEENDGLSITDHKSLDFKTDKNKLKECWKQMSLYAIPTKEKFGEYPKRLNVNAFRKQEWFTKEFISADIDNAKKWVLKTVEKIYHEDEWEPSPNWWFCNFICEFRGICEHRPQGV